MQQRKAAVSTVASIQRVPSLDWASRPPKFATEPDLGQILYPPICRSETNTSRQPWQCRQPCWLLTVNHTRAPVWLKKTGISSIRMGITKYETSCMRTFRHADRCQVAIHHGFGRGSSNLFGESFQNPAYTGGLRRLRPLRLGGKHAPTFSPHSTLSSDC